MTHVRLSGMSGHVLLLLPRAEAGMMITRDVCVRCADGIELCSLINRALRDDNPDDSSMRPGAQRILRH